MSGVGVCVPVCVCPCMCALVGIITCVYARVSVWSGCVCLCPSVHYEVVGVVNTSCVQASVLECMCTCLCLSMHVRMAGVVTHVWSVCACLLL